jgi:ankyrin repeat protein
VDGRADAAPAMAPLDGLSDRLDGQALAADGWPEPARSGGVGIANAPGMTMGRPSLEAGAVRRVVAVATAWLLLGPAAAALVDPDQLFVERQQHFEVLWGNIPLRLALEEGDVDAVQRMIEAGADLNEQPLLDPPLLHLAAGLGLLDVVDLLIERGVDVDVTDARGRTAVHHVASRPRPRAEPLQTLTKRGLPFADARPEVIDHLVGLGGRVDTADREGRTPLFEAAAHGDERVVACLVRHGADVNVGDRYGISPLHVAAEADGANGIAPFLDAGADVSARIPGGDCPLHWAAGWGAPEAVRLLLERGACLNVRGYGGGTPLHVAARRGRKEAVDVLLEHGADEDPLAAVLLGDLPILRQALAHDPAIALTRHNEGRTLLHWAAEVGNAEAVALLLENGADHATRDPRGRTALHVVAQNGKRDVAEVLLAAGAEVNATDFAPGATPLLYAAGRSDAEFVGVLLEAGGDVNAEDAQGRRPLDVAGSSAVSVLLREAGAAPGRKQVPPQGRARLGILHALAAGGRDGLIRELMEAAGEGGLMLAQHNSRYDTPLSAAIQAGQRDTVRLLVAAGAQIQEAQLHAPGPLRYAVYGEQPEMVRFLLDEGADADAVGDNGRTALHAAAYGLCPDTVRLLLEAGADPNRPDYSGLTPLHCAAQMGRADLVELLLQHGADADATDRLGRTPALLAARRGAREVVLLLLATAEPPPEPASPVGAADVTADTPIASGE